MSIKAISILFATFLTVSALVARNQQNLGNGLVAVDESKGGRQPSSGSNKKSGSENESLKPIYKFEKNTVYIYEVKRRIFLKLMNKKIPLEYEGRLALVSAESGGDRVFAHFNFQKNQDQPLKSAPDLLATFNPTGEEVAIWGRGESPNQKFEITKDAVNLFFFTLSEDSAGKYEANFSWSWQGSNPLGKKQKIKYLSDVNRPSFLESSHFVTWAQDLNLPSKIWGKEHSTIGEAPSSMEGISQYEIKFIKKEKLNSLYGWSESIFKEGLGWKIAKHGEMNSNDKKISREEVMAKLKQISTLSQNEQLGLFGEILTLLNSKELDAKQLAAILDGARDPSERASLFKMVAGSMATNGSAQALAELVSLYNDNQTSRDERVTILAALATTEAKIDPKTRDFLSDVYSQESDSKLREGAAYAYGSSMASLENNSSQKEVSNVFSRWNSLGAGPHPEKMIILDLIGNSGRAEFIPLVKEAYLMGLKDYQGKSIMAARSMNVPDSLAFIEGALNSSDSALRFIATQAIRLGQWNERYRAIVANCSLNEASAEVKLQCQEILKTNSSVVAGR